MNRILSYFLTAALAFGFAACSDQNDVVDELIEELNDRPIVKNFPYTLTAADYSAISTAAVKDAGDNAANKALAEAVKTTNSLNSFADPLKYIPGVLGPKYPALGLESAIQVTYAYTPDYLAGLTTNPPAADLTTIIAEDFDAYTPTTAFPFTRWDQNGWKVFITKGTKYWGVKTRQVSGVATFYSEVTANSNRSTPALTDGTILDTENEIYVVSPAINLAGTTDNNFSFDLCVGYYTHNGLSVLITEDATAATDPASVTAWDNVTSNFTIPATPTNTYGPWQTAGRMNLDTKYAGKTIYIAFRYVGGYPDAPADTNKKTTTYQIDNVLVASGKVINPQPGEVYINDPEQGWIIYPDGIALVEADYAEMGITGFNTTTVLASDYLPTFLARKFSYLREGSRKAIVHNAGKDEYVFNGDRWSPTIVSAPLTEQYVNDGEKWIFDPTINYAMVYTDHQMVVDWMRDNGKADYIDSYGNTEYYYGFSGYVNYNNVNFRLSYRADYPQDTEFHALSGDPAAQLALLWRRLEQEGMPLFLQLKFPDAPAITQGVQQYYNINVQIHSPEDGTTNVTKRYIMRYRVAAAGNPATFEFVSTAQL